MCLTVRQSLSRGANYGTAWVREVWHVLLSIQQGSGAQGPPTSIPKEMKFRFD
uniref:Uncharacterized protein n=1 Tax=Wuchereria bancrofti TaxID=6293 RepID=A0AAF5RT58_WUCBA